jgi:chromosome segregation ATPase
MSARATRPSPPKPAAAEAPGGGGVVQQVLAERRDLMVANERLRLELEELQQSGRREDPRLHVLELENRALRAELATLREDLAWFQDSVKRLVEEIEKASP